MVYGFLIETYLIHIFHEILHELIGYALALHLPPPHIPRHLPLHENQRRVEEGTHHHQPQEDPQAGGQGAFYKNST